MGLWPDPGEALLMDAVQSTLTSLRMWSFGPCHLSAPPLRYCTSLLLIQPKPRLQMVAPLLPGMCPSLHRGRLNVVRDHFADGFQTHGGPAEYPSSLTHISAPHPDGAQTFSQPCPPLHPAAAIRGSAAPLAKRRGHASHWAGSASFHLWSSQQ